MTIPEVKEVDIKELAAIMRPHIKNGPACLEAIAYTMLNHDPGFLNIFRGIQCNVTPATFMGYRLLYNAAKGRLPVLNSVIQESIKDDFWNIGLTNEDLFRTLILGETARIRENNPLYVKFMEHLVLQTDDTKTRDKIYEEGIMTYVALERAMWSKAPSERKKIRSPTF